MGESRSKFMGWDKDSLIEQKRKGKEGEYTKEAVHGAAAHHLMTDAGGWLIPSHRVP